MQRIKLRGDCAALRSASHDKPVTHACLGQEILSEIAFGTTVEPEFEVSRS